MGYQMTRHNRFARTRDVTMVTAAVVTATGAVPNSSYELGDQGTLRLNAVATAVGGTTPSITLTLETSPDNATWTTVAAFAAVTANGTVRKIFTGLDRFVRLNATAVTGTTPTGTFTVSGESC